MIKFRFEVLLCNHAGGKIRIVLVLGRVVLCVRVGYFVLFLVHNGTGTVAAGTVLVSCPLPSLLFFVFSVARSC